MSNRKLEILFFIFLIHCARLAGCSSHPPPPPRPFVQATTCRNSTTTLVLVPRREKFSTLQTFTIISTGLLYSWYHLVVLDKRYLVCSTQQYIGARLSKKSLIQAMSGIVFGQSRNPLNGSQAIQQLKFIYSEKVTEFCEISTNYLTGSTQDK